MFQGLRERRAERKRKELLKFADEITRIDGPTLKERLQQPTPLHPELPPTQQPNWATRSFGEE